MEDRLIKTAEILNKYPSAICICSGGKGKGEKISEAVAMKKYLENCSIKNKIYTEDQSKTTIQNIEYSIQLIDDIGVSENYKIISVSSWYHMARIQYIFNQRGYSTYSAASEVSNVIEMISSVVREYMAYTKMLFTL